MYAILAIVSLIPAIAYFWLRRSERGEIPWYRTALIVAGLFAVGLFSASPFITSRGVGSGEAYNYSLALADAVTQLRAGEIPLVGQTEYAFNGRIHPLRNAPYLFYLAGGLDALTFRQLTFWQLQNLSLALSLVAAAFSAYGSLRWSTGCRRVTAFILATIYTWCPALLGAVTINLFMTVHAAVFVPLVIGACVRHFRRPALINDVVMAIALAATWLAHPPVALWLTLSVVLVRGVILWHDPSWQRRAGLVGAAILGGLLSGFVFVSAGSLNSELGYFPKSPIVQAEYVNAVLANLQSAWPASVLPVSHDGNALGDLQFGYAGWLLLGTALAVGFRLRRTELPGGLRRSVVAALAVSVLLLLAFSLPLPALTSWLWNQLPLEVDEVTNVWPMQRLYLVASGLVIFLAALALPDKIPSRPLRRNFLFLVAGLASVWTTSETWKFIRRDYVLVWNSDMTRHSHLSSNLDLTVTSYAFFSLPPTFVHGVMDPLFQNQLIKNNGVEVSSPLASAQSQAPVILRGEVFRGNTIGVQPLTPTNKIVLRPGKRYLLSFDFHVPPLIGAIDIVGPLLRRHYLLPVAGQPLGFGMNAENGHSLSLWTASPQPEEVEVRFYIENWPAGIADQAKIADFTLQEVEPASLPIRLDSLLPLRLSVDSPDDECFLSTPRSYIPGYEATVNGRAARAVKSPTGQVMVAVPKGRSDVELRYVGTPWLLAAFWTSAITWFGVLLFFAGNFLGLNWRNFFAPARSILFVGFKRLERYRWLFLAGSVLGLPSFFLWQQRQTYLESVGPIRITFLLPLKQTGRQQPILVTGRTGAGAIVFVHYLDDNHLQIGADIWGALYESEPLRADYYQIHDLVVNASGLYPLDHPRVHNLSPQMQDALRNRFSVEFDGRLVISLSRNAYESTVEQVSVGETRIGGSLVQPRFAGEILRTRRLPFPIPLVLTHDQKVQLKLQFPRDRDGGSEPLLSIRHAKEEGVFAVAYLAKKHLRFWYRDDAGHMTESVEFAYRPEQTYDLELIPGHSTENSRMTLIGKFNGTRVVGQDSLEALNTPQTVWVGLSQNPVMGLEPRFTGPKLEATLGSIHESGPAKPNVGFQELVVRLPIGKDGHAEPLLTTGKTGKGDFAYITYIDSNHVRFGLDHWGVAGAKSEIVPLDYSEPHLIEISMGSLFPNEQDAFWKTVSPDLQKQLKSSMQIRLDDRVILSAPLPAYPSTAAEITVGANRIKGASCDPKFTGEIYSAGIGNLPR